ncbi:MAG: alkaline phosphatase family protein [Thermoanaerobaculia bacterium]
MRFPATIALLFAPCLLLQACGDRSPRESAERRPLPGPSAAGLSPAPRTVGVLAERAVARPPILFIGLDGADWQQLEPLLARGAMPHLARLRGASAWGELESEVPALSPLLWTSMLTGVSPLEHGILDFSRFAPGSGLREPIGSDARRSPAIWNALTWAGKRVNLLGLWATHPAEPVQGLVVSDRLFGFLNVEAEPPPGAIYPPGKAAWARAELARVELATGYPALQAYLPGLSEAEYREHAGAARAYDHPVSALRRILVETRLYGGMAESLLAGTEAPQVPADLTLLYLQGTDSIGHVFAPFAPPRQPAIAERDFERYREVPERFFRELDDLLGRLLERAERSRSTVVVASDHGFLWQEGRPDRWASTATQTAARWHRKQGIWLVRAAGVAPGRAAAGRLRQIFPTLLTLAGLPAAAGAEGRPLAGLAPPAAPDFDYSEIFRELAARRAPARSIPDPTTAGSRPDAAAQEEIAKLQALGYIGAGEATTADAAVLAAGGPDATLTASSWNNAGVVLRGERRDAEARAAFERALALEPKLAAALWNLSELLFAGRESGRADELLARALAADLPDGVQQVIGRAIAEQRAGEIGRSLALLDRALALRPNEADLWLFRGRFRVEAGDCRNAVADLARAGELAPASSDVFAATALAQLCVGDRSAAATALRRALELAPDEPRLRALLAELESTR